MLCIAFKTALCNIIEWLNNRALWHRSMRVRTLATLLRSFSSERNEVPYAPRCGLKSTTRMALALNNLWRLICHQAKKLKQTIMTLLWDQVVLLIRNIKSHYIFKVACLSHITCINWGWGNSELMYGLDWIITAHFDQASISQTAVYRGRWTNIHKHYHTYLSQKLPSIDPVTV